MSFIIAQTYVYGDDRSVAGVALQTVSKIGTTGIKIAIPVTAAVIFGPVAARTNLYVQNSGGQALYKKVTGNPPTPTLAPADSHWSVEGGFLCVTLESGEALAALAVSYS